MDILIMIVGFVIGVWIGRLLVAYFRFRRVMKQVMTEVEKVVNGAYDGLDEQMKEFLEMDDSNPFDWEDLDKRHNIYK